MALWLNGVEVFPDHTPEEEDARLADMIDQCEDCGTHTPAIRAFGTDHSLLCPACYAKADENVRLAEYHALRAGGLGDYEARATAWPEGGTLRYEVYWHDSPNCVGAYATEAEARASINGDPDMVIYDNGGDANN